MREHDRVVEPLFAALREGEGEAEDEGGGRGDGGGPGAAPARRSRAGGRAPWLFAGLLLAGAGALASALWLF